MTTKAIKITIMLCFISMYAWGMSEADMALKGKQGKQDALRMQELIDMKLSEEKQVNRVQTIERVPGGWNYKYYREPTLNGRPLVAVVFVPLPESFNVQYKLTKTSIPWFLWSTVRRVGVPYYSKDIHASPVHEYKTQDDCFIAKLKYRAEANETYLKSWVELECSPFNPKP